MKRIIEVISIIRNNLAMETWASAACKNFSIPSPSFVQTTCFSTATEPVPVAWFESQDIFLSDTATGTSARSCVVSAVPEGAVPDEEQPDVSPSTTKQHKTR